MPVKKGFKEGTHFPVHLTNGCLHLAGVQVVPLALPAPERARYEHGKMLPCRYCEDNGRGSDSDDGNDHGLFALGAKYVGTCKHMCMICNPARTQGLLADKCTDLNPTTSSFVAGGSLPGSSSMPASSVPQSVDSEVVKTEVKTESEDGDDKEQINAEAEDEATSAELHRQIRENLQTMVDRRTQLELESGNRRLTESEEMTSRELYIAIELYQDQLPDQDEDMTAPALESGQVH